MLTKSKIILNFLLFLFISQILNLSAYSKEFDISADIINIDQNKQIVDAKGSVVVFDDVGNKITSDKGKYFKKEKILEAFGSVIITNVDGEKITTDKIRYLQEDGKIFTYENSKVYLNNGYEVTSDGLLYDTIFKVILSNQYSTLTDLDGNSLSVEMFKYDLTKKIFSTKGNIKFIDYLNNKHFFDEAYVDTANKKVVGSNARVDIDKKNVLEANRDNDPRFVANTAILSNTKSYYKKGVYTLCQKRGEKCPPWTMRAKNITHDKAKKTIYYDHSVLRVYDIPVFYFPKFWHPDPSVKRQSGFLRPNASDSEIMGTGFNVPYFWAISHDKDLTFTPTVYVEEHPLYLAEYRQVTKNSDLILDIGHTEGYKDPGGKRTDGARNHYFARSNVDLDLDYFEKSELYINIERASNDTYFRVHDINTSQKEGGTGLVSAEDTSMENEIKLSFEKDEMYFNIKANAYENLKESTNSRYEFITPDISFGNQMHASEKFGELNWKTRSYHKNYKVDQETSMLVNDIIWKSNQDIDDRGILTEVEGIIKNTNYDADGTEFKNDGPVHEIAGVLSITKSLPMQKQTEQYSNTLSPKIMLRYAPSHMRDLNSTGTELSTANLYSLNKTGQIDVIDKGTNAIIGFDFHIAEKKLQDDKQVNDKISDLDQLSTLNKKLSLSLGQSINFEYNEDMPKKSSLDKKLSDIVGDFSYFFSKKNKINYKFSLDQNLTTLNYNNISSQFKFGIASLNIDYLEQHAHIGTANYIKGGLTLDINDSNSLNFETRKNFETSSTEYINLNYQYLNDCFRARIEFKRDFYSDQDIEPTDTVRLTFAILPYYQFATGDLSGLDSGIQRTFDDARGK